MPILKELLTEQLQTLLDVETQLTNAIPKMAQAAEHPKLKEAFEKHLVQTQTHAERLRQSLQMLGGNGQAKPSKGIAGLVEEGEMVINEGRGKSNKVAADLALIAAAQKVEHYEISAYGTARSLARLAGEIDCARLLSLTLGEEEGADYLLTAISDPMLQYVALEDMGGSVNLESVGDGAAGERRGASRKRSTAQEEKVA